MGLVGCLLVNYVKHVTCTCVVFLFAVSLHCFFYVCVTIMTKDQQRCWFGQVWIIGWINVLN